MVKRKFSRTFRPQAFTRGQWNWSRLAQGLMAAAGGAAFSSATRGGAATSTSSRPKKRLRGGSTTVTTEKKSIHTGRVINEGTGGQCSYFTGPKRKSYLPAHVENALPPQVIQVAAATQKKSGVGAQQVWTALELCNPNQVTGLTGDKISNVLMHKATGDVTLNNIYLSNCYVIIYDIMARKDVSASSLSLPDQAWSQGNTDESAGSAYTYLGSTPWQSEVFNQYYEVKQVTNVVLGAGQTHVHKVRLQPNRLINSSYAQYTPYGFRGTTYFCMVEFHGSPANDVTTQTQVSVGVGGLNVIVDQEHTFKIIQKQTPTISASQGLVTSFTNGEQVVNTGGTTIVAQAEG